MPDEEVTNIQNDISVSSMWSKVDNTALYSFANKIIEKYREEYNVIVSGRDLTTIYPNMTCHIFITADLDERVNRRFNQYNGKYSKQELRDIIIKRDKIHESITKNFSDNKHIKVDVTDCKDIEESAKKVVENLIDKKFISENLLIRG